MKLKLGVFTSLLLCGVKDTVGDDTVGEIIELEVAVDLFASETGYYVIENKDQNGNLIYPGLVPDIPVVAGNTYIFKQGAGSNWYHPVGFAYLPDGAHGAEWGGEERDEVEGAADLSYKLDATDMDCPDAGDTGLDCYEPLFFYPRDDWKERGTFSAELTITQDVVETAKKNGGVLYYFCHIHSKMSGRIIITEDYDASKEMELYSQAYINIFDATCGTYETSRFSRYGNLGCGLDVYVPGKINTFYEECLHAINCKQNKEMRMPTSDGHGDPIAIFSQQMIPHHQNAVNMAKAALKNHEDAFDDAELKTILMEIINVQNYQVHEFRNYLGTKSLNPEWVGEQCSSSDEIKNKFFYNKDEDYEIPEAPTAEGCIPSELNLCMKLNYYASETGYYEFENYVGPSPDIVVEEGKTYVFHQVDKSNWYHPVGFAYLPDGAHGATWGGEELEEVEGADDLTYLINSQYTTCEAVGDTGLDCYEPEFFYPREEWSKKTYSAALTITADVVEKAKANGGVLYYFCHIHSKMSGRLIIKDKREPEKEATLYVPFKPTAADTACGTSGLDNAFTRWGPRFVCGELDTPFEQCLQSIDYKMSSEMRSYASKDNSDPVSLFCEMMIPHHSNAVNMAKMLLKHHPDEVEAVDGFEGLLWEIINVQNYQIHEFRGYLKENPTDRFCSPDYTEKFSYGEQLESEISCEGVDAGTSSYDNILIGAACQGTLGCRTSCIDMDMPFKYKGNSGLTITCESLLKRPLRKIKKCLQPFTSLMCPKACGVCH